MTGVTTSNLSAPFIDNFVTYRKSYNSKKLPATSIYLNVMHYPSSNTECSRMVALFVHCNLCWAPCKYHHPLAIPSNIFLIVFYHYTWINPTSRYHKYWLILYLTITNMDLNLNVDSSSFGQRSRAIFLFQVQNYTNTNTTIWIMNKYCIVCIFWL